MKIYFIGTGSAVATAKRDNTSLYFETDDWNLLVDCPGSIIYKFSLLNIDYTKLQGILITHKHPDHMYGLPSVIHALDPFSIRLPVYASPKIIPDIKKLLDVFDIADKADLLTLRDFTSKNPAIETFSTKHTPESVGIMIMENGKKTVYTSDTGPIPEFKDIAIGSNYLIHDCFAPVSYADRIPQLEKTHTSAEKLAKMAETCKVKNLVPIHFSGEHKFSVDEIKAELEKNYSGNIIIPEDLSVLEV
ncbi:MAG: MBL fold metallo-hydrolase [Elusimicrobiota bacterium]